MAGDWIKMRLDLQTHPKVVRILSATKADKFRAVGGLHAVWSVFDTHSADGRLSGYTPEAMDHIIGWPGFSEAMISVGWMTYDGAETLMLPEFDEHNGKSGKRRAEDQKRKRDDRKSPQDVRNLSASKADEKLTREEKRREEKNKDKTTTSASAPAVVGGGDDDQPEADSPKAAPLPARQDPPPPTNPALALTLALRPLGVAATSMHPTVIGWADKGVSLDVLTEAVRIAREHKGSAELAPRYLEPIVERLLNPPPDRRSVARNDSTLSQKFNFAGVDRSADVAAMHAGLAARGVTAADLDDDSPL